MKTVYLILTVLIFSSFTLSQNDQKNIKEADSVLYSMRNLSDNDRLRSLDRLAIEHSNKDIKYFYFYALIKEAERQDNTWYKGEAYYLTAALYYGLNPDSMRLYIQKAEPIMLKTGRIDDAFRMKTWNIYSLANEGESGLVLPEVQSLRELSKKMHYPAGMDMATQCLANFYYINGLTEEAIKLYREALTSMTKRHERMDRCMRILRQLINIDTDKTRLIEYSKIVNSYINTCLKTGLQKLDETNSIDAMRILYFHTQYMIAYQDKDAKKMLYYIQQSEKIVKGQNIEGELNRIHLATLLYYNLINDYTDGIELSNTMLKQFKKMKKYNETTFILKIRSELLAKAGRDDEAMDSYHEYYNMQDSLSSESQYKALASFSSQHKFNLLKSKNEQLELNATQNRYKMTGMYYGIALLILMFVMLIVFVWILYKHSERAKKARLKAEEADLMKSTFLANMNHEIRTPLNAIVGFSQVLTDEENQESRKEYAQIIDNNNILLQQLIGDVLDLSKIESNELALKYSDVELAPLMKEIYNSIILRMPQNVELQIKPSIDFTLQTDKTRLTQVLTNLLNNAIKHTQEGFIRFGYDIKDNTVVFFVEDTGEGIPEDKLETIFGRFTQLSSWNRGVGLGLAICKGIVTQMEGTISVKSRLNEGSTFIVTLPVSDHLTKKQSTR
jgi:signal transduction histidine kinase